MSLRVEINSAKVIKKIKAHIAPAQSALDLQVVKDSNFYCPFREGDLQKSALRSKIGSGVIVWDTSYANRQYYDERAKNKDINPNARAKWFEHAKAAHKRDWVKAAGNEYHK